MCVFSDLSLQKTMCLSHPHRKTSFTQQECEITMFQDWRGGGEGGPGGWGCSSAPSGKKSRCTQMTSGKANDPWIHQEISVPPQLRKPRWSTGCADGGRTQRTRREYKLQRREANTIPSSLKKSFLKCTLVFEAGIMLIIVLLYTHLAIIKVETAFFKHCNSAYLIAFKAQTCNIAQVHLFSVANTLKF